LFCRSAIAARSAAKLRMSGAVTRSRRTRSVCEPALCGFGAFGSLRCWSTCILLVLPRALRHESFLTNAVKERRSRQAHLTFCQNRSRVQRAQASRRARHHE
jgi:hypothetical protein